MAQPTSSPNPPGARQGGETLRRDAEAPSLAPRHALELAIQLELTGGDAVLAGLAAARVATLFASLDGPADPPADDRSWQSLLARETPPSDTELQGVWSELRPHQPGAPSTVSPSALGRLREIWPLLGPTEYLLGKGGDTRLMLDPLTGLNAYGCSSRPRPWAVTFASSTASSISARGYTGAEEGRCLLLREALAHGALLAGRRANERVRAAILAHYGLPPGTRVVLTPSGTDAELAALAVTWLADPATPIANVLMASEETGAGVPLAATGHHFATLTARGVPVTKGDKIDGFVPHGSASQVELIEIPIRSDNGALRGANEVDAQCTESARKALARGARVLLHVMDQSKTGLVAPSFAALDAFRDDTRVDVVVDACQARLSAASVRRYFDRGDMVLVTGSKFFTGPPFAGALLLPPRIAARLDGTRPLPAGLASYFGRFDWPESVAACAAFPEGSNVGLALRWEAALAEMKAFESVPRETVNEILERFASTVGGAIAANPDLVLHDVLPLDRPREPGGWDSIRTIFAFSVRAPERRDGVPRRLLDPEEAARLYAWLNSDVSPCIPGVSEAERALAARLFHIGQPVGVRGNGGHKSGALRLSAGARLVSGEPSHAGLPPSTRIESELADALSVLAKVSLILEHFDAIRAINPRPRFRGGVP
ncbi:MAG: hypothetical protein ACLQVI_23350 [Polyangiaceae bacterium]